ncbi:MAG: c-type cytochrome [Pedobacter sp.]|nr:MAG: c-type cytochrome [Pedobacter sp.]
MKRYIYILLAITVFSLYQCKSYKQAAETTANSSKDIDFSQSPVVPASESISKMQIEDGFEIKLFASEPLVTTPVAMSFDTKGRMWVVEMNGYMPDTLGNGEDVPNGKIAILEDKNNDGVADSRTVFLDSLVLPRAICLIDNGVLVAEPPKLWFYEVVNDKAGKRTLVDSVYATDGNVEHQPNGLLRGLDNWIYNAKSNLRYRKINGQWIKQTTHFRGQWGISQDNYGRLYYNGNSSNVEGDYFSPGFGALNKNQRGVSGYNERPVPNNRVYPARPTPGVNRGYMDGILDDSLRLVNFTAACGPLIYRGGLFGTKYEFNAFVPEPSANLIKRNILREDGVAVKGEQAYANKEFLRSVDERFRPVNLINGPDGAIYVADMYRGIIQHKTYETPYLINQIKSRSLTAPLSCGRIYKIVPKGKTAKATSIANTPQLLVAQLEDNNGFIRDMVQQKIIDQNLKQTVPYLKQVLANPTNSLQAIHAMWSLEGLNSLETNEIVSLAKHADWHVKAQVLTALPSLINQSSYTSYRDVMQQLFEQGDERLMPYVAFVAGYMKPYDQSFSDQLMFKLAAKYPNNNYVSDAIVSNAAFREESVKADIAKVVADVNLPVHKRFQRVIASIKASQKNRDPEVLAKMYPKGVAMFQTTCQTCHSPDGNGIASLAPPLNKSEWVTGDKNKLISIVLFGLTGPVKVNGHVYQTPEIAGDMPAIAHSEEITDEDIAQMLSYIRASWQNDAGKIETKDVTAVRAKLKGREKAFTTEELSEIK